MIFDNLFFHFLIVRRTIIVNSIGTTRKLILQEVSQWKEDEEDGERQIRKADVKKRNAIIGLTFLTSFRNFFTLCRESPKVKQNTVQQTEMSSKIVSFERPSV
jgi:hypothetical protein